jgi:hypothetical protein
MIRSRTWKYIHRYPYGPHELYDLANDPNEDTNLINTPAHAGMAQQLKGELDAWFHRYVDPARDAAREPVAGRGQIDLAGPAAQGRQNHANDWSFLAPGKTQADLATFLDREAPTVKKGAEPKI